MFELCSKFSENPLLFPYICDNLTPGKEASPAEVKRNHFYIRKMIRTDAQPPIAPKLLFFN